MKKIFLIALGVFTLVSCSDKNEGNVQLTGEIKGLSQGKLYVQRLSDTVLKPIKIIKFDGESSFKTSINVDEPEVMFLFLDRGVTNSLDNNISFFAEKGSVIINSDVDSFIGKSQIIGGKNQQLFNEYKAVIAKYNNKNLEYVAQRIEAMKNSNLALVDSLNIKEVNIIKQKYLYTINFCMNNPDQEVAAYVALTEVFDANKKYLNDIYNNFSDKVKSSKYGIMFKEYLDDSVISE